MTESIISCQVHDYIEIACMYGYRVRLDLSDHDSIEAKPITTLSKNKQEFLVVETAEGKQEIELNQIKSMQALTENSHFGRVNF